MIFDTVWAKSPTCVDQGMRENFNTKESMKKILMGLGLIALLAVCASHENSNGMGGTSDQTTTTSDQSMKTDSINKDSSGNSSDQHNNAVNGTGSSTATNSNTGSGTP